MSKTIYIIDVREDKMSNRVRRLRTDSLDNAVRCMAVLSENGLSCTIQKDEIDEEE